MRLSFVLCVFCVVFVICVDSKRGYSSRRSKPKPSTHTRHRTPPPHHHPPAPPKNTQSNNFLDAERQNNRYPNTGTNYQNPPAPIGFDNVNHGTNNKPIGFEGFKNKPESGKIGFEGVNPGNKPSAPVLPSNNFGQTNPGSNIGQSYPGQKYPGQNFGQSYPNQQYPNSNFGQAYPNQQYPNSNFGQAYPNQQYPNSNFGQAYPNQQYPNSNFGQAYPKNPYPGNFQPGQSNMGYPNQHFGQSYPGHSGSYYGNAYPGQSPYGYNNQGYPGFGSGYNNYHQGYGGFGSPFGGGSFGSGGGGLFSGGFFGSNNGFNSYGNGYGQRNRFGLGGLPLPIPIPIPIPFGGFGGYGSSYNSHRSHEALNTVVQKASVDSKNSTSVYLINNNTVLPCTRQHFKYESYNVTIVTCTVLNCTAVSLKTVKDTQGKIETNYGSVTMCLDPVATITTNSSGSNLPRLSDVRTYSKSVCEHINTTDFNKSQIVSANSTNGVNLTEKASTETKENSPVIEKSKESVIVEVKNDQPSNSNTTTDNTINSNLTGSSNTTDKPCIIFNCSAVELCMPKVEIRCDDTVGISCNYSVSTFTSCVELNMCSSQNSLAIDREVKLNTKKDTIDKDNFMTNQTLRENVTVIAYLPPSPLVSQNISCLSDPSNPCGYPTSSSSSPMGVNAIISTASPL